MLDFSNLTTPENHGDILVAPEPREWAEAVRTNHDALGRADRSLLGRPLSQWRRQTREAIAGNDDAPVIALGHQPSFIHPGVWAKHVVARRLATALDGVAVHLIVDSDVPTDTALALPSVRDGRVTLERLGCARAIPGAGYEQIERVPEASLLRFTSAIRETMGDRFETSQMEAFLSGAAGAVDARDWVDQLVAGRRAVEHNFDVKLTERRVSTVWCNPLLLDVLLNPVAFALSYNRALADYRRANRVRGAQRPIPDLAIEADRCEVPYWARELHGHRYRLFVSRTGDSLRFFAGSNEIGTWPRGSCESCDDLEATIAEFREWRIRPRAIALTIWARLLLADLFVHGIGGAKYDRISDAIIADYYGLAPPRMACVSATLHLDLPGQPVTWELVRRLRHDLRDRKWNPQRHLPAVAALDPLIQRRVEAVRRCEELRKRAPDNHEARRRAFEEIRRISTGMLERAPDMLDDRRADVRRAIEQLEQNRIARGREYFFALHDGTRLQQLTKALPDRRDFRV